MSASIIVPKGPGSILVKSMTFRPDSGPLVRLLSFPNIVSFLLAVEAHPQSAIQADRLTVEVGILDDMAGKLGKLGGFPQT